MAEHLILEVGDIIKISRNALLSTVPAETPLTVVRMIFGPNGDENQYALDWPGRTTHLSVIMQYGVDKYAKKLVSEPAREERAG